MKKCNNMSLFLKGILKENPVFVLILGTCPTLAVTGNVIGALGMGVAVLFVLILSSVVTWLLYNFVLKPFKVTFLSTIVFISECCVFVYAPYA